MEWAKKQDAAPGAAQRLAMFSRSRILLRTASVFRNLAALPAAHHARSKAVRMIANKASIGTGLSVGQITLTEAHSLIIRHGLLRNLSHAAYRVLEYLLTHFNKLEPSDKRRGFHRAVNRHDPNTPEHRSCWPKQDRIAAASGMSVSTVKRAVVELEDFGILRVQRTTRPKAGGYESRNRYFISFPSRWFAPVRMEDGTVKRGAAQARPLTRNAAAGQAARAERAAARAARETGRAARAARAAAVNPQSEAGVTGEPWPGVMDGPLKGQGQRSRTSCSGTVSQPQARRDDDAEPTPSQPDPAGAATANPPRAMDGAAASPATHNADGALARAAEGIALVPAAPPRAAARQAQSLIDDAMRERIDAIHRRRAELVGWTRGGEHAPAGAVRTPSGTPERNSGPDGPLGLAGSSDGVRRSVRRIHRTQAANARRDYACGIGNAVGQVFADVTERSRGSDDGN